MDARSYSRYQHTLKMAYRLRGVPDDGIAKSFPSYFSIMGLHPRALVAELAKGGKARLNMLHEPKGHLILDTTSVRTLSFSPHEIMIPLIDQTGVELYGSAPTSRFDFLAESSLGLLDDAKVIYDIGSGHGVGAMYYALIAGTAGHIVCSEPAIIDIEISALLFVINGANSIAMISAGIDAEHGSPLQDIQLAGFSEATSGASKRYHLATDEPLLDLRHMVWEKADFLKLNVGCAEFDAILQNPWIFNLATHMHLKLHIPDLMGRGLDYRQLIDLIPLGQFTFFSFRDEQLVEIEGTTQLSGTCSLMMKRRTGSETT